MSERFRFVDVARSWIEKAEHDLLNIENNLVAKDTPWVTVTVHAQQCAEKYLKALLVLQQIDFPKDPRSDRALCPHTKDGELGFQS
jgi:HEPN domain-containing protein